MDAREAPSDQRAQELAPERLGLRGADVQADDLAAPGLMHRMGDDHALARDAAASADLLDLGVGEQIRIAALKRTLAERLDLLIEQPRDPAHLALADPQPQALDELIDPTRRDATHIGLPNHRHQRLLRALARLQQRREVAAPPQLRDLQLDLTGPGVPPPGPIPIAMRRPVIGPLAELGADQLADLSLHHLSRDRLHRLADHVRILIAQHTPDDLLDRHPVPTGHRRPPFTSNLEKSDEE